MLVYSFFDYTVPLLKKISEKIRQVFRISKTQTALEIAIAKLNESNKEDKSPSIRQKILKTVLLSAKWVLEFLIRRYLYHRNPFFVSDGIIVVVKPKSNK